MGFTVRVIIKMSECQKSWEPGMSCKTLFQSLTLDMLNNFCFHVYAQKSVFIGQNVNVFIFLTSATPSPVTLEVIELVPS